MKHLDEGYSGLRDQLHKSPSDTNNGNVELQVKKEEEEVRKKEKERNQLIDDIARRAKLQDNEKMELFSKMNAVEKELQSAKNDLAFMRRRQEEPEERTENESDKLLEMMSNHARNRIIKLLGGREFVRDGEIEKIKIRFNTLKGDIHRAFIKDMRKLDLIDSDGNLNDLGAKWLKSLA